MNFIKNIILHEEDDSNIKYQTQCVFICLGDKLIQIQQSKISAISAIKFFNKGRFTRVGSIQVSIYS